MYNSNGQQPTQCRCLVGAIELALQSLDCHVRWWGMGEGKNEIIIYSKITKGSRVQVKLSHLSTL